MIPIIVAIKADGINADGASENNATPAGNDKTPAPPIHLAKFILEVINVDLSSEMTAAPACNDNLSLF